MFKSMIKCANNIKGVYMIKNSLNRKVYIGSSTNIGQRWYTHISNLNNKTHHSTRLQSDWDDLIDKSIFKFEILEKCNNNKMLPILEQKYIDKFESCDENKGYNSVNSNLKSHRHIDENNLYIPLKLNKKKDKALFDIIRDCNDKNDFIKNAIYYYIVEIEKGRAIDRFYPRNKK